MRKKLLQSIAGVVTAVALTITMPNIGSYIAAGRFLKQAEQAEGVEGAREYAQWAMERLEAPPGPVVIGKTLQITHKGAYWKFRDYLTQTTPYTTSQR